MRAYTPTPDEEEEWTANNDVAVVRVFPFHVSAGNGHCRPPVEGSLLQDVVGAFRPKISVATQPPFGLAWTIGYPGDSKYLGRQWFCVDTTKNGGEGNYSSALIADDCLGFNGNSGGPLLCDDLVKCTGIYKNPEVIGVFSRRGGLWGDTRGSKHTRLLDETFGVMYDAANKP